jgi:hypothetical protein
MKNLKIAFVFFAAAVLLAGCVVSSVYPFYSSKDVIFDSSLLGKWNPINPKSNLEETNDPIEFRVLGTSAYLMGKKLGGDKPDWFETHLFEIQGQKFLDQSPFFVTNRCFGFGFIPEHYVCALINHTNTLQLAWLRQDWLEQLLTKDTNAIRHTVVRDFPDSKGRIVLTAETEELQKFVLKYVNDTNAFFEIKYQKAKE